MSEPAMFAHLLREPRPKVQEAIFDTMLCAWDIAQFVEQKLNDSLTQVQGNARSAVVFVLELQRPSAQEELNEARQILSEYQQTLLAVNQERALLNQQTFFAVNQERELLNESISRVMERMVNARMRFLGILRYLAALKSLPQPPPAVINLLSKTHTGEQIVQSLSH